MNVFKLQNSSKGDEILASYCPSLVCMFSTTPSSNPTSKSVEDARASLFEDSSLLPGFFLFFKMMDVFSESFNYPTVSKTLKPYIM